MPATSGLHKRKGDGICRENDADASILPGVERGERGRGGE